MRTLILTAAFAFTAAAQNPLIQAYMPRYTTMKQNLVESAQAMPEEHYAFKLTPPQRSFGDWIGHTVMLMHNSCAAMKGESAPPMDHSKHAADKPKAMLVKELEGAAAFCDGALKDMTDAKALAQVTVNGKPTYPVNAMIGMLTTLATHYGNMVGYLRAKNIVPPSTARGMKK